MTNAIITRTKSQELKDFETYVINEFKVDTQAAIEIKYSYSCKIDKFMVKNHTITMSLKFYNEDAKLLKSSMLKFVNNNLPKLYEKKLITINPGELNNKFLAAKKEIIDIIRGEYEGEITKINMFLKDLKEYNTSMIDVDDQFRREIVNIAVSDIKSQIQPNQKNKKKYDM